MYTTLIAHAKEPGCIYWRNADESERPTEKKAGAPKRHSPQTLLELLGPSETLSNAEWRKLADDEHGMSRTVFFECKAELEKAGKIKRTSQNKWTRKFRGSPESPESPETVFPDSSPESPSPKGDGRTFRTGQTAGRIGNRTADQTTAGVGE